MTPSPRTPRPLRFQRFLAATLTALALSPLLSGCAGPQVQDYAQEQPALDLKQYFNGPMQAHGIFTDRAGKVQRRFVVAMTGTWQGNQGTLDERFTYSDGKTERRVWRLTDEGGGRWSGRADDVVGVAQGVAAGTAWPDVAESFLCPVCFMGKSDFVPA